MKEFGEYTVFILNGYPFVSGFWCIVSDGMSNLYPDSGVWFSDGYAIFALVQERDSWTLNGMVYI